MQNIDIYLLLNCNIFLIANANANAAGSLEQFKKIDCLIPQKSLIEKSRLAVKSVFEYIDLYGSYLLKIPRNKHFVQFWRFWLPSFRVRWDMEGKTGQNLFFRRPLTPLLVQIDRYIQIYMIVHGNGLPWTPLLSENPALKGLKNRGVENPYFCPILAEKKFLKLFLVKCVPASVKL